MPFFDHFDELKCRLSYILLSFLFTFLVCYIYSTELFYILTLPLIKTQYMDNFIYTNLVEIIYLYIKLALCSSVYLTLPLILYHIWNFISFGLYPYEKYIWSRLLLIFLIMFFLTSFLYYSYFLPFIWNFFLTFQIIENDVNIKLYAKITEYFSLFLTLFFIAFLLIILPLVNSIFIQKGNFKSDYFYKNRKYYYMFTIVLILIMSPPEIISQVLILIPTLIFYELLLFLIILQYTYYFHKFNFKGNNTK
jgi:sec-independent protein translocase protein TatC